MNTKDYSSEKKISRLINASSSGLSNLLDRARQIESVQILASAALPADCRTHCQITSYKNGVLKLQADSAAWATKLRYQQRQIIAQLKKEKGFQDARRIQVKVLPSYLKPESKVIAKPISHNSAVHLQDMADTIDDPTLSKALRHITEPK